MMSPLGGDRLTGLNVLLWSLLCEVVWGRSLSAWSTGLGAPQVIMFDDDTGKIFYSLCNSNSTPIFPADDTAAFHLEIEPAEGTSVAGTGYQDDGRNKAAIHYLAKSGGIVQALFACDATGHYVMSPGAWIVTADLQPPVLPHPDTDLAALVVGETGGYRVFYKDENGTTSILQYKPRTDMSDGGWSYGGHISLDNTTGLSIHAGFVNPARITAVVSNVDDVGNVTVRVATLQEDEWLDETFPYPSKPIKLKSQGEKTEWEDYKPTNETSDVKLDTEEDPAGDFLEAYDGAETRVGIAFDAQAIRNIFYIGNDSALHRVQEHNGTWRQVDLNAAIDVNTETDTNSDGDIGGDNNPNIDDDGDSDSDNNGSDIDGGTQDENDDDDEINDGDEDEDEESELDGEIDDEDEETSGQDEIIEDEIEYKEIEDEDNAVEDEADDKDENDEGEVEVEGEDAEDEDVEDETDEEEDSEKDKLKRANDDSDDAEKEKHRQEVWPTADDPNADFAITFDSNQGRIWIYYMVNGSLAQIHQSAAGTWESAFTLPTRNDTEEAEAAGAPEGGEEGDNDEEGLSSGDKTGVGVGVGVGLPIAAAAIAAYMFVHSRRSRQNREAEFTALRDAHAAATTPGQPSAADLRSWAGSPAPDYASGYWGEGYWANGQWVVPWSPDQQQQQHGVKHDSSGAGLAVMDPRYSMQMYGASPRLLQAQFQHELHEMPHQEPMHEVEGDGQVPEMSATTPLISMSTPPPPPSPPLAAPSTTSPSRGGETEQSRNQERN